MTLRKRERSPGADSTGEGAERNTGVDIIETMRFNTEAEAKAYTWGVEALADIVLDYAQFSPNTRQRTEQVEDGTVYIVEVYRDDDEDEDRDDEDGDDPCDFCGVQHDSDVECEQVKIGKRPTVHELRFNTCTCGKWKAAGTTEQIEHLFSLHVQAVLNS